MKQMHKIRKQSLLLNFMNEAEAASWNRSASEFNQKNIVPVLDKLFDQYAGKNEYFEIEKLEVNIGLVSEENFLSKLENELKKNLDTIFPNRLIAEHDPAHAKRQTAHEVKNQSNGWIDTFRYFLEYGTLPWNSRTQIIKALQKEITIIISQNGLEKPNGLKQQLLNPGARKRLYYQFSTDFNIQILSSLFVSEYQILTKLQNGLTEIFKSGVQNSALESKIRIIGVKSELIRWIGLEASFSSEFWPLEYIEFFVKTVFRKDQQYANELLNKAVQLSGRRRDIVFNWVRKYLNNKDFGRNDVINLKEKNFLTGKNQVAGNDLKFRVGNEFRSKNRNELKPESGQLNDKGSTAEKQVKYAEDIRQNAGNIQKGKIDSGKNKVAKESVTSHETKYVPEPISIKKEDLKKPLTGIKAKSKSGKQRQGEKLLKSTEEKGRIGIERNSNIELLAEPDFYYLSHTGVLLTWPYLTPMFRKLGFTESNQFKEERLQHRAVHLLAYIATGKKQSEEPQLLIAKLLCGVPLHVPVLKKLRLNKKEKSEVSLMLENLIANWPILKNTSVEGLRSSFFARDGKLINEDGQWKIIVEQKSFDMLLDHLPYPVSIIKLPWMNEVLKVDWM